MVKPLHIDTHYFEAHGLTLVADDSRYPMRLVVSPRALLTPDLRAAITDHRYPLLFDVVWPPVDTTARGIVWACQQHLDSSDPFTLEGM